MAWQGIPFPSFVTNTVDAGLTVTKIPEIVVNTSFGWDNVAGSIAAAFIGAALPTAIAWYTIYKNDQKAATDRNNQQDDLEKARETQVHLAEMAFNAQVLSGNRQQWINTLRSYCSEFIMSSEKNKRYRRLHSAELDGLGWGHGSKDKANQYFDNLIDSEHRLVELGTNIELMLNPSELTSKAILLSKCRIISLLENEDIRMFYQEGSEVKKEYDKYRASFVKVPPRCLKREWERVKTGK